MEEFKRKNTLSTSNNNLVQQGQTSSLTQVNQARAIEELKSMMIIAKQFPRNLQAIEDKIVASCSRMGVAERGIYSYNRAGREIAGASIRLAEVLKSCMGNMTTITKEEAIDENTSRGFVVCHDLENNTKSTREFIVVYSRKANNKYVGISDPRDRREHFYSTASRHLRNVILEQIPTDLTELALDICKETLVTNIKTDKDSILNTLNAFKEFGVTRKMLEHKLGGRKIESITPLQMAELRSVYVSLRDGLGQVSDFFKLDLAEKEEAKEMKQKKTKKVEEPKPVQVETEEQINEEFESFDELDDIF